jgi:hypothetical protein
MTDFHSESNGRGKRAGERLARLVGRVLLWGCVLLLLIRGVASYLTSDPHTVTQASAVILTRPAGDGLSSRGRE